MAHLRRVATSSRHHDYSDRESGNGDDSYGSDQDEDTRGTEARGVGPGPSRGRVRQGRDTPAPSPASRARNARTADTDTAHDAYSDQDHESDAGPSRPRKRPRVTYGSPDDEIVVDFEETEAEFDSYESESCSSESDSGSEYEEPTTLRRRNRGRPRGRPRRRRSTASSDEEEDGQSNGAANTSAASTNTSRATEQPPINRRQSPIPGAHPTHNPNPTRQTGLTHLPADSASTVTVAPVIKGRPKPFLIGLTTEEVNEVLQHPSRQQRRIARLVQFRRDERIRQLPVEISCQTCVEKKAPCFIWKNPVDTVNTPWRRPCLTCYHRKCSFTGQLKRERDPKQGWCPEDEFAPPEPVESVADYARPPSSRPQKVPSSSRAIRPLPPQPKQRLQPARIQPAPTQPSPRQPPPPQPAPRQPAPNQRPQRQRTPTMRPGNESPSRPRAERPAIRPRPASPANDEPPAKQLRTANGTAVPAATGNGTATQTQRPQPGGMPRWQPSNPQRPLAPQPPPPTTQPRPPTAGPAPQATQPQPTTQPQPQPQTQPRHQPQPQPQTKPQPQLQPRPPPQPQPHQSQPQPHAHPQPEAQAQSQAQSQAQPQHRAPPPPGRKRSSGALVAPPPNTLNPREELKLREHAIRQAQLQLKRQQEAQQGGHIHPSPHQDAQQGGLIHPPPPHVHPLQAIQPRPQGPTQPQFSRIATPAARPPPPPAPPASSARPHSQPQSLPPAPYYPPAHSHRHAPTPAPHHPYPPAQAHGFIDPTAMVTLPATQVVFRPTAPLNSTSRPTSSHYSTAVPNRPLSTSPLPPPLYDDPPDDLISRGASPPWVPPRGYSHSPPPSLSPGPPFDHMSPTPIPMSSPRMSPAHLSPALSPVPQHLPTVTPMHLSPVPQHLSPVLQDLSPVPQHLSPVPQHLSPVPQHQSLVPQHLPAALPAHAPAPPSARSEGAGSSTGYSTPALPPRHQPQVKEEKPLAAPVPRPLAPKRYTPPTPTSMEANQRSRSPGSPNGSVMAPPTTVPDRRRGASIKPRIRNSGITPAPTFQRKKASGGRIAYRVIGHTADPDGDKSRDDAEYRVHPDLFAAFPGVRIDVASPFDDPDFDLLKPSDLPRVPFLSRVTKIDEELVAVIKNTPKDALPEAEDARSKLLPPYLYTPRRPCVHCTEHGTPCTYASVRAPPAPKPGGYPLPLKTLLPLGECLACRARSATSGKHCDCVHYIEMAEEDIYVKLEIVAWPTAFPRSSDNDENDGSFDERTVWFDPNTAQIAE